MIPEVNPYNNYRGDGVATLFDYDFFIQNGSQLIVEHIDENDVVTRLEENIDYEIVVIEEEFAGYIKFPIEDSKFGILQENETLSLQLTLPFEQISEYGQSSLLDLNSIEFSLDYLTRLCQILKRQMERSVRVNEGLEATPEQLLESINNNAIVSTNAATLASQKADEAMESANVVSGKVEEVENIYSEAIVEIEKSSNEGIDELNKIKQEAQNFKDELVEGGMFKFQLFDTKTTDRILSYEETFGWALQGTYVYSTAIAGERYGYPDFIQRCIDEKNSATATEVTLGSSTITMYINDNGHQFYDIADKDVVDAFYNTYGIADYYGIDEENQCVFLPRNKYFYQFTDDTTKVNKMVEAGLPNVEGDFTIDMSGSSSASGAFYITDDVTSVNKTDTNTNPSGVAFSASRSNSIYGNSNTVQPPSSLKLLYYCVGNTQTDTAWVDVVTQVQGGVKDLEDKKNACIEEIEANANSFDNVTHRNITNCWTKIPQRINYTQENGITVLAGSQVIVPYGTQDLTEQFPIGSQFVSDKFKVADTYWNGSKFFVWAELVEDKAHTPLWGTAGLGYTFFDISNGYLASVHNSRVSSGEDEPTQKGSVGFWYDPQANYVKRWGSSGWVDAVSSLPLWVVNFDTLYEDDTNYTVDLPLHVFNGWGYIGLQCWIDNLEGLASNGYNFDGTYNNAEIKTNKLQLFTARQNATYGVGVNIMAPDDIRDYDIRRDFSQEEEPSITGTDSNNWYNPKTNKTYIFDSANWVEATPQLKLFEYYSNETGITSIIHTPQTFRPLDYSEVKTVVEIYQKAYITETYKNGASGYRIWSDGLIEQWGSFTGVASGTYITTITFLKPFSDTNYTLIGQGTNPTINDDLSNWVASYTAKTFGWRGRATQGCKWYAFGY